MGHQCPLGVKGLRNVLDLKFRKKWDNPEQYLLHLYWIKHWLLWANLINLVFFVFCLPKMLAIQCVIYADISVSWLPTTNCVWNAHNIRET